ncbi:hypothetical protein [Cohnella fermenti]|uniref:Uncharacterized protein n=1 Tax=Cohnella fermenti TaxID=2565925 RepID=A0A4S4C383_9BACL|nr:hypothetical protein [Cohnella fermenti]THF82197.1 hypothetical protein E6C55_07390 [Cohnella fermenti]
MQNERGSVLLYCLLLLLVLAVVTPVILNSVSTDKLSSDRMEREAQVSTLSSGAAEAFLSYVKQTGTVSAIRSYPGWGTKTIALPNGKQVKLTQAATAGGLPLDIASAALSDNQVESALLNTIVVTITASAGTYQKSFRYSIQEFDNALTVDVDHTIDVTSDTTVNKKYLLTPQGNNSAGGTVTYPWSGTTLKEAISKFLSDTLASVNTIIAGYNAAPLVCSGCVNTPEVLKLGNLDVNGNLSYGTAGQPVIVIAENINFNTWGASLAVIGDVVVSSDVKTNDKGSLTVMKDANGQFGNLISQNTISFNKDGDVLSVAGMIFAKAAFRISDSSSSTATTVTADSIVSYDQLQINGKSSVAVNKYIIVNKLEATNGMGVSINANNDILAADYISVDKAYSIAAGGLIAGGNKIDFHNTNSGANTISATGAATALQCGTGNPPYGSCTGGVAFSLNRQ